MAGDIYTADGRLCNEDHPDEDPSRHEQPQKCDACGLEHDELEAITHPHRGDMRICPSCWDDIVFQEVS